LSECCRAYEGMTIVLEVCTMQQGGYSYLTEGSIPSTPTTFLKTGENNERTQNTQRKQYQSKAG